MKNKWTLVDRVLLLCAAAAFGYFLHTYPGLFPEASIRRPMDSGDIRAKGEAFIRNIGYNPSDYRLRIAMEGNADEIAYLERTWGSRKTNRLLTDSIPGYFWTLRWNKNKSSADSSKKREDVKEKVDDVMFGHLQLSLDLKGNPIRFEKRRANPQASTPGMRAVSEPEARALAERFFDSCTAGRLQDWTFSRMEERPTPEGSRRLYRWKDNRLIAGQSGTFEVGIRDGRVDFCNRSLEIPKTEMEKSKSRNRIESFLFIVPFLFFILCGVVFLIKRLRQDLVDMKSGWIVGLLVFIGWALNFLLNRQGNELAWEMAVGFLFTTPFVVGGAWLLFVLGESFTREVWEEKLLTSDMLRRKPLFPELGKSLLFGIAFACLCLGVYSFFCDAAIRWLGGVFVLKDNQLNAFSARFPATVVLGKSMMESVYFAVAFGFFLLSFLKKYVKQTVVLVLTALLLLLFVPFAIPSLSFPQSFGTGFLMGLLFIGFFLRYDWMAIFTGMVFVPVLFYGAAFLTTGTGVLQLHGAGLFFAVLAVLVWALLSLRAEPVSKEAVRFVPEYVQRIYEKERIQRELEIARNVQLNFLPRIQPQVHGLSVASFCIPAREVGGDYYDFIYLGPRKLGVAIGDVSGKGIPAAFYMTMTKGFLKSQARTLTSPMEVLIHLNELFYENSERGMFISMVYGVFDLDARTLTFARAGHNPMLAKRSGGGAIEEVSSNGIALGLEAGPLFEKNIQEKCIRLKKGDIFFFYTDGLNEAKNRKQEEFGEKRLKDSIRMSEQLSAEDMLKTIRENIHGFTGDTLQHDDMTAVIVKILP